MASNGAGWGGGLWAAASNAVNAVELLGDRVEQGLSSAESAIGNLFEDLEVVLDKALGTETDAPRQAKATEGEEEEEEEDDEGNLDDATPAQTRSAERGASGVVSPPACLATPKPPSSSTAGLGSAAAMKEQWASSRPQHQESIDDVFSSMEMELAVDGAIRPATFDLMGYVTARDLKAAPLGERDEIARRMSEKLAAVQRLALVTMGSPTQNGAEPPQDAEGVQASIRLLETAIGLYRADLSVCTP